MPGALADGVVAGLDALDGDDLQIAGVLLVVGVPEVADGAGRGEVALGAAVVGDAAHRQVVVLTDDLGKAVRKDRRRIRLLEDLSGCRFQIISTGANRKETVMVENPFGS